MIITLCGTHLNYHTTSQFASVYAENFSDALTEKGMEAYSSGDIKEAIKLLKLAAEEKNPSKN